MCLCIVTVPNVGGKDEKLKRVIFIDVNFALFSLLFHLFHSLLTMAVSTRKHAKASPSFKNKKM
jgi:hypothetical protein